MFKKLTLVFGAMLLVSLIFTLGASSWSGKLQTPRDGTGEERRELGQTSRFVPSPDDPVLMSIAEVQPCTVTLNGGDDIQAAIDGASPGDVICLNAGLYEPVDTIQITVPVTLQGPGCAVDPRACTGSLRAPGDASTEAVVDGQRLTTIFRAVVDDATICGLDIKRAHGDMIETEDEDPVARFTLSYNIIHEATGDEGIQLRECTDCVVEYNYIFDIAQDGVNMCCGSVAGVIRRNELHDIRSENAAIYIYEADAISILDNLIYDVPDNDGIKMGTKSCRGGDDSPNGTIRGNVIHDVRQDCITVYCSNTLVKHNECYNSTSENGAVYISCSGITNVIVEDNFIHDNGPSVLAGAKTYGIRIGKGSYLPEADTITVNNNCVYGNEEGMENFAPGLLDATGNWWGASDGPSGDGPGTGDSVFGNVAYDPWLDTAECALFDEVGDPVLPPTPCYEPPLFVDMDCFAADSSRIKIREDEDEESDQFKARGSFLTDLPGEEDLVHFHLDGLGIFEEVPFGDFDADPDGGRYEYLSADGSAKIELDWDNCDWKVKTKGIDLSGVDNADGVTHMLQIGMNLGEETVPMTERNDTLTYRALEKIDCCDDADEDEENDEPVGLKSGDLWKGGIRRLNR